MTWQPLLRSNRPSFLPYAMPYFNDDGTEFNPDLIPKPSLCVACANDDTDDEIERIRLPVGLEKWQRSCSWTC